MIEILLATRNPGKIREIREIAADHAIVWHALDEYADLPDAPETGQTFAENARQKALYYASATEFDTLADDSGLEVDCLGGAPGIRSARFAGPACDDAANNSKLIEALSGVPRERRSARFRCAMAWVHDGAVALETEDTIEGVIVDDPRGANGFGYDPHFFVPALDRTLAEAAPQQKNALSHRGKALRTMLALITERIRTS